MKMAPCVSASSFDVAAGCSRPAALPAVFSHGGLIDVSPSLSSRCSLILILIGSAKFAVTFTKKSRQKREVEGDGFSQIFHISPARLSASCFRASLFAI